MKIIHIFKHTGIILASVIILLGVPLWASGSLHSLFSGNTDAVSSASVILDQPSGNYVVMINKNMHTDTDKLNDWVSFFSGGDVLYIFEDICAGCALGDAGGIEMAESFRSRLPENQMKARSEDVTLLLSRADADLYDIIILSEEFAHTYHAETALNDSCVLIELKDSEA